MPRPTSDEVVGGVVDGVAQDPRRVHVLVAGPGGALPRGVARRDRGRLVVQPLRRWRRSASSAVGERLRVPGRWARAPRGARGRRSVRMACEQPTHVGDDVGAVAQVLGGRPHRRGRSRVEHGGVDALDGLLPHRRERPHRAERVGRSYCAPSNRHASQVSAGTGIRPSCRAWHRCRARFRPGRRGRGRVADGCVVARGSPSQSGTGSGTIRSERRPGLLGQRDHLAQRAGRRARRPGRRRRARPSPGPG